MRWRASAISGFSTSASRSAADRSTGKTCGGGGTAGAESGAGTSGTAEVAVRTGRSTFGAIRGGGAARPPAATSPQQGAGTAVASPQVGAGHDAGPLAVT